MPKIDGWVFPRAKHKYPLLPSERVAFRIRPRQPILQWAEENINLVAPGYARPGPFRARPWQREIINASMYWDKIYTAGPTQIGKTVCYEIPEYYYMAHGINGMVAYANSKIVEGVFKTRTSEMIMGIGTWKNPVLTELWSGKEDDITIQNIRLKNCQWRIASAQNKNDLASWSAGILIGDEVAKWEKQTWNPVRMLEGRAGEYESTGDKKLFLVSSPFDQDDYLYKEVFKDGTIILQPHYKCPHCGQWQTWTDSQIRLRDDTMEHSPAKIRELKEAAVYYQCIHCKDEITEAQRVSADEHIIWAAPQIDVDGFSQSAEIINPDGSIVGRLDGGKRAGYDAVCYNPNRLVDVSYSFWKCLAYFFECKNDPQAKKVYDNETMARWTRKKTERIEISYLESRKQNYKQYGPDRRIPDDVVILTFGADSQDDGFYQSWYGWGYGMSCYLVKCEFVQCPIDPNGDKRQMYDRFLSGIAHEQPIWSDNTVADFRLGFIDRGGHRADDVDFICQRMGSLHPYIGLTRVSPDKPLIYKSANGDHYMGQSEQLSSATGVIMMSDEYHLPADTPGEYLAQITRQFFIKKVSPDGQVSERWVHDYQGPDHYRDAFNLAYAAAKHLQLDRILYDRAACDTLLGHRKRADNKQIINTVPQTINPNRIQRTGGGYFHRALGGR